MGREFFLQPWCWLMCCGGVPLYGFLKGLICVIFCCPIFTIAATAIVIVLFPLDVIHVYWTIGANNKWGPTVKIVSMILAIIPLLLVIPIALIVALIFSFIYSIGAPVVYTFMEEYNFWYGGIGKVYKNCCYKYIKEVWNLNWKTVLDGLKDFRTYELKEGETVFEIPIYWVVLAPAYALLGIIVSLPVAFVTAFIKYLPVLGRTYYNMWNAYFDNSTNWIVGLFVFFIAANILLPLLGLLIAVVFILFGIFLGVTPGYVAYKRGFVAGFKRILNNIYDIDEFTNQYAFKSSSCLPCLNFNESFMD